MDFLDLFVELLTELAGAIYDSFACFFQPFPHNGKLKLRKNEKLKKNILFKVTYNGKCFVLFLRNKTRCNVLPDGSRGLGDGEDKCFN